MLCHSAVTATPSHQVLTWKSFWKRKLSRWIKKTKNWKTHTTTNSPLTPPKKPPKPKYPTQQLYFFFFCQATFEMFCERPNLQISGMSKFCMTLSCCILEKICCSHVRRAKCWAATELTRKHFLQSWNCGLNGCNPHRATVDAKHKLGINHFSSKAVLHL